MNPFEEAIIKIKEMEDSYLHLVEWLSKKYPNIYTDWCCQKGEANKEETLEKELEEMR
jgi:hypothetical protein